MINRYQGNSGRVERIEEPAFYTPGNRGESTGKPAVGAAEKTGRPPGKIEGAVGRNTVPQHNTVYRPGGPVGSLREGLGKLLGGSMGKLSALETDDIILLLVLYLMYRESGDSELLMIMGAMFLL